MLKRIIMGILIILAAVSVFQGSKNALIGKGASADFQYDSALLLRMGINPYDESLCETGVAERIGTKEFYGNIEANQFPSLLAILIPYTFASPQTANILWLITNLVMTILMIYLIRDLFFRDMESEYFWILMCLMIAGLGWRNSIGMGQHTIFSFALFLLAIWLSNRGKTIGSGVALSLSLFKYTLTGPLALYLLYKKRYKEIAISLIIHIILTILCAVWLKDSVINMITKPLEVSSWLCAQGYLDIPSMLSVSPETNIIVSGVICTIALVISLLKVEDYGDILFSILIYLSLIAVYHRAYDYFVLILPLGVFLYLILRNEKYVSKTVTYICLCTSVFIFIWTNYVSKVLHELVVRKYIEENSASTLDYIVAFGLYVFVAMLVALYLMAFQQEKIEKRINKNEN